MDKNKITILAIETSCDETAAAIIMGPKKVKNVNFASPKIKSNIIYSQLDLHQKTKGIVPEVASRAHIEKIIDVISAATKNAKIGLKDIDIIAVTVGPGLIGSLLVGIDTAKSLAYILGKPVISINHIEAHLYAVFARKIKQRKIFPAIAMIVSGGHTSILLMRGHGEYRLLGTTIDDAAGEAFDKVAKILSLSYPGGPNISFEARKAKNLKDSKEMIQFPRPMIDSDNLDFSFSGLKTSVLYKIRDLGDKKTRQLKPKLADQFQKAIIDVLIEKISKAARIYQAKSIILGGGVVANELLRSKIRKKVQNIKPKINLLIPELRLCTDNAAIIGLCAYYQYLKNKRCLKNFKSIHADLSPKF